VIDTLIWFLHNQNVQDFDRHESYTEIDGRRSPSDLRLTVEWAPAYELVVSLTAFIEAKRHKSLDLGPTWLSRVRGQVGPGVLERVKEVNEPELAKRDAGLLFSLIWQLGDAGRDAQAFLDQLAELSVGELYERLVPTVPDDAPPLPRDLGAMRDRYHALLAAWHAAYFQHLDPAILDGLAREAQVRSAAAAGPMLDVIEEASNGLRFEPPLADTAFVLIPQYHDRPYNHLAKEHERVLLLYPADLDGLPDEALPIDLLRLTRGLADESRLRILRFLARSDAPRTMTEAARAAGLSQSTVHHHLLTLRAAGLVRVHIGAFGANRYTLRPRALTLLGERLATFLDRP
jgi:DNA-binding transcriptional ArsR family regulator